MKGTRWLYALLAIPAAVALLILWSTLRPKVPGSPPGASRPRSAEGRGASPQSGPIGDGLTGTAAGLEANLTPGGPATTPPANQPPAGEADPLESLQELRGVLNPVPSSDGGLFILASLPGNRLGILRLDPSGEALWTNGKRLGLEFKGYSAPLALAADSEGGCYLAGTPLNERDPSETGWDVMVMHLDRSGRSLWNANQSPGIRIGGSDRDLATSLIAMPDGGCTVLGRSKSFGGGQEKVWVVRLDGSGRSVWNTGSLPGKVLTGEGHDRLKTGRAMPDGGVVLIGRTSPPEDPAGVEELPPGRPRLIDGTWDFLPPTGEAWVLCLDKTGKSLWNDPTRDGYAFNHTSFQDLEVDGSGDVWIVGGGRSAPGLPGSQGYLARFESKGACVWNRGPRYKPGFFELSGNGGIYRTLKLTSDGGCVLVGTIVPEEGGPPRDWLHRMQKDASGLWNPSALKTSKRYGMPVWTTPGYFYETGRGAAFQAVLPTQDGGFVLIPREVEPSEFPRFAPYSRDWRPLALKQNVLGTSLGGGSAVEIGAVTVYRGGYHLWGREGQGPESRLWRRSVDAQGRQGE